MVVCYVFDGGASMIRVLCSANSAYAQGFTCNAGSAAPDTREWVVNLDAIASSPALSVEEAAYGVQAAMDEWNNSSTGIPMRYLGDTDCVGTETSGPCCNYHLITWENDCDGPANFRLGLSDTYGGGRSRVRICGDAVNWEVVQNTPAGTWDFIGVVAHELGHAIGVDHPGASNSMQGVPTMRASLGIDDDDSRQLYRYDHVCSDGVISGRLFDEYGQYQVFPAGTIGAEFLVSVARDFDHRDVIDYPLNTTGEFAYLYRTGGDFRFRRSSAGSPVRTVTANGTGISPSLHYAEGETYPWRIYYPYAESSDPDYYTEQQSHHAHVVYSSNEFASFIDLPLYACNSPLGFETCGLLAWDEVRTGDPLSLAFDDFRDRTVVVWSHQDRTSNVNDRELRVSIGESGPAVLSPSYAVPGAFSHSKPGVACATYEALGVNGSTQYDCIIAYSDSDTSDGRIRVARFWSGTAPGGTHYYPIFDSATSLVDSANAETASGVEAWFVDGYWYIAFLNARPMRSQTEVLIYRSDDSRSWTRVLSSPDWSGQVPAVAVEDSLPTPLVYLSGIHE